MAIECSHCQREFALIGPPPCGQECPWHREYRIEQAKVSDALLRLRDVPNCPNCRDPMRETKEVSAGGVQFSWKCVRRGCGYYLEEVLKSDG